MSDLNEQPMMPPMPTADCATFMPLLPLLSSGELTTSEDKATRSHVAGCAWCQSQLATYDIVDAGLRRHFGDARHAEFFSPEDIMNEVEQEAATLPGSIVRPGTMLPPPTRKPQRRLTAMAAVAAVLLLSLFAGLIFVSHGGLQGAKPTASATISTTPSVQNTTPFPLTPSVSGNLPQSWTTVTSVPQHINSLQFAPSNTHDAYLCTNDGPAASPLSATPRLYKSTDGGQSWQLLGNAPRLTPVPSPVQGPVIPTCAVFVNPNNANDIFFQQDEFAAVGGGFAIVRLLSRSQDGGATWQQLTTLDRTNGFTKLTVIGNRLVGVFQPSVYGSSGGSCPTVKPTPYSDLVGSDDGGMTWHNLGQTIEGQGYSPFDAATAGNVLFAVANIVPTATCTDSVGSTLWRSTDGGTSWVLVKTSTEFMTISNFASKANNAGFYGLIDVTTVSAQSGTSLLYSSDSGATWTALPGLNYGNIQTIVAPSGAILATVLNDTFTSVLVLWPNASSPSWSPYAPTPPNVGAWQVVLNGGNGTLWSVYSSYLNQSVVQYLPLP